MFALLAGVALAQDFRAWQGLYEGMLYESAEGDAARASRWYEGLIVGLPENDPTQGALHLQLARTLYLIGDLDGAREELAIAAEYDAVQLRTITLQGQIDALERRIQSVPYDESYEDGVTAWLHSWQYGVKGSISVVPAPGENNPALHWYTEVSPREDDQIQVWLAEGLAVHELSLRVSAEVYPAYLMLVLIDDQGRWYALNDVVVAETDRWLQVEARLKDFTMISPEGAPRAQGPAPSSVRSIALRDLSTYYTSDQGPNTVLIDDFSLR